ncbi:MAG: hypothetical protein H8E28_16630 [Anaerolineae bacterium]|nr:hypothetical protein [Anaerolineae bacterium]
MTPIHSRTDTGDTTPDFVRFCELSLDDVALLSPRTMIYAASGTRRAAALNGISTSGDEFAVWTQGELFRTIELLFLHGICHLFMPMLGPSQFNEATPEYQKHLWRWFEEGLTGTDAIAKYQRAGWRVRIAGSEYISELKQAGRRLIEQTPNDASHTLWCYAIPAYETPWRWMLEAAQTAQAKTLADAKNALYGDNIPPASLYLSTGKPLMSSLQLPPLLVNGPLQCYWSQRPGYSLDQRQLRAIIYDYAYLRKTWKKDKSGRAEQALAERDLWERGNVLGVGIRKGPFWYPAPFED